MNTDPVLKNLLFLYAGIAVINVAISVALWARERSTLYRWLVFAWGSLMGSLMAQGALSRGDLPIITGFLSAFAANLCFAQLLGAVGAVRVPSRTYLLVLGIGFALTVVAWKAGGGFTVMALPSALAVSLPCLATAVLVVRKRHAMSTSTIVLVMGCVLFSLHNIDFAFLRPLPTMATLGFSIAILVAFALSVAGPAVALEQVTEQHVRLATELDVARRIQALILPQDQELPGMEVSCHVRPAASVGGDYLDLHLDGDRSWFLLGDVTGHGLGAGLVMLMAQSTMSTLLQARPELSPRELNYLANRILAGALARLKERRHLTAISILRVPGNRLVISGSHEALLVYRASTQSVEALPFSHFPVGLGYQGKLGQEAFQEEPLDMAPGDVLLAFTDGITEAAREGDPRRGLFGTAPLEAALIRHARAPLERLKADLLAQLEVFTGGVYYDDVTLLVLRAREEPA